MVIRRPAGQVAPSDMAALLPVATEMVGATAQSYFSCSHRDSNLVAVAQFLAVAARPCFLALAGGLMILNRVWASSLVPKPSGVCRNSARPAACTVSRLPLAATAFPAAEIRVRRSEAGVAFRNT